MYCVVRMSVTPWLVSIRSRCQIRCRAWGSRPVVGSSAIMSRGLLSNARATSNLRFIPVESSSILLFFFCLEFHKPEELRNPFLGLVSRNIKEARKYQEIFIHR